MFDETPDNGGDGGHDGNHENLTGFGVAMTGEVLKAAVENDLCAGCGLLWSAAAMVHFVAFKTAKDERLEGEDVDMEDMIAAVLGRVEEMANELNGYKEE